MRLASVIVFVSLFFFVAVFAAMTLFAYPLQTLNYVYGNSEAISAQAASGASWQGLQVDQNYITQHVQQMNNGQTKSSLENLEYIYSTVGQSTN